MTSRSAQVIDPAADGGLPRDGVRRRTGARRWARVGMAAQIAFVASMLIAASWQGPRYSVLSDAVSDMTAVTAPRGMFLVVVFTLCGAATIVFVLRSVWPTLRPGGWRAALGSVLLALSVPGLGDLLSAKERLACRMADPGCTAAQQISNAGGRLDGNVTTVGVFLLVIAGFFLAAAMRRTPGWQAWAWPSRWTALLILAFSVALVLFQHAGFGGLFERLVAITGAAGLASLACGVLRRG
ncbi:DUF998 domain-containing protein [Streptomyces sp. NRRL F-5126]|uniref:DUF998 domain-containing protein n=1 Tax=Streptomyces sp. NRRL F-5126 TaxID=1463857 RepID=UPI000AD18754|nr:DUF998 domain-containing protein [Streptomyces sp. NRRL F-5126]